MLVAPVMGCTLAIALLLFGCFSNPAGALPEAEEQQILNTLMESIRAA